MASTLMTHLAQMVKVCCFQEPPFSSLRGAENARFQIDVVLFLLRRGSDTAKALERRGDLLYFGSDAADQRDVVVGE